MSTLETPFQDNPYQAPQVSGPSYQPGLEEQGGLWRKGRLLVMHKLAPLPPRCVKSNEPIKRTLTRKLTWHHPAVFVALLINLLVYAILAIVLSKRATIYLGLSDRWFGKRRRAMLIGWTAVLASIGMFIAGVGLLNRNDAVGPLTLFGAFVLFIVGAIYGLIASRMVAPVRITDDYIWLKGVHPDFLNTLPVWPYTL
ncbi:MAG: hypothetical protein KY475_18075 [Planctomycetes bacterium]|nr:hypothetical protein [Planctomycetota bacterium]